MGANLGRERHSSHTLGHAKRRGRSAASVEYRGSIAQVRPSLAIGYKMRHFFECFFLELLAGV